MPQTFSASDAVELAVVERDGFIESRHTGSAIVLAPDGSVHASFGAPDALILPRSALKPLQAVGLLSAGARLAGVHLALASASHSGTNPHVAAVSEMLAGAGLTEDALACPAAWPTDAATRREMIRDDRPDARVCHNCSGKHAGMLAACVQNGWPTEGYTDLDHPLQVHLREVIERLTGEKVAISVADGCSAPAHALSLAALARGVHRIGTASERSPFALHRHAAAVRLAALAEPWAIAGPGASDTVLLERAGVFAKLGAEGVQVAAAPDGTVAAVKVLDGGGRAAPVVALRLLVAAGAISPAAYGDAASELDLEVRGGDAVVGRVRATV
ncbi:asparaginase [Microbacterium sp. LRZ72]|uniref:asparaginase n=1 Tax=Microbacterium sp. LRZ72 TaxID=2942481 RepID=UPI0029B4499A|nr:asparaginase [Microbacterium sp. LRZ72]MDX2377373.1 asparaginase [Microbacterium sp. LRZ72]